MLALLLLVICYLLGYSLFSRFIPGHGPLYFRVAAYFVIGTAFATALTYTFAYLFKNTADPLLYANLLSYPLFIAIIMFLYGKELVHGYQNFSKHRLKTFLKAEKKFLYAVSGIFLWFWFFHWYVLHFDGEKLKVGLSVFSDFGPHIAMIRSFSMGSNFPTQYPHFPDGSVRYHFLFQFFTGNLEYLGLPITWAFNLLSTLAITAVVLLLYHFAYLLTKQVLASVLACIFFFFRSSFAFFDFLGDLAEKKLPTWSDWLKSIWENTTYVGKTMHEDWGLYTQNVYANQRHLPFGIALILLVCILFYPHFKDFAENISLKAWIHSLKKKTSWIPENTTRAVFIGLLMGVASFFNGAAFIALLLMLFFMALFSKYRLEHCISAGIALFLFMLQVKFFTGMSNVKPEIVIGFLAAIPSEITQSLHQTFNIEKAYLKGFWDSLDALPYILIFYFKVLGILPFLVFSAFFVLPRSHKLLSLAFLAPLLFASTIKLTPDIPVNHKYVMISVIFLNIWAALLIAQLFKFPLLRPLTALVIAAMTVTGAMDLLTYFNINQHHQKYAQDNPAISWIRENSKPRDIFLSHISVLNTPLEAGRPIYYGWPYFAWSAGYQTDQREQIYKAMLHASDSESLKSMLKENSIAYVYMDDDFKSQPDTPINREIFMLSLPTVYHDPYRNIRILKVE